MFTESVDPDGVTPAEMLSDYAEELNAALDEAGAETAVDETGLDAERVESIGDGEVEDLTVEEAADVLALSDEWPDAESLRLELQDHVMLEMSSAVVDVDTLAAGIEDDLDPKEVQQRVEGRQPMTLGEYARITHFLASENPW